MKHSVEMGSDSIIFRPSSIRTDSTIQKLMRRRDRDRIRLFLFFSKKGKCAKILFKLM